MTYFYKMLISPHQKLKEKQMKISLCNLKNDKKVIEQLTHAYRNSYNTLSAAYKTPEEMALYTENYFYCRIRRFAAENEKSQISRTFVISMDDKAIGFVRYSRIPDYYKENQGGEARDLEKGEMDGYEYAWYRKVKFVDNVKLDDSTMILNQIYLDPSVQHVGIGTYVLAQTLPKMKEIGVKNLILEYNAENHNAAKFYKAFGFKPLADTEDLDHIIRKGSNTKFYVSKVKMVHVPVEEAMQKANAKFDEKRRIQAAGLSSILIGLIQNKQKAK